MQAASQATSEPLPLPDASGSPGVSPEQHLQEATSPAPPARMRRDAAASPAAASPATSPRQMPRRPRTANGAAGGEPAVDGAQATGRSPAAGRGSSDAAPCGSAAAAMTAGSGRTGGTLPANAMAQEAAEVAWGVCGDEFAADARDLVLQRLLRPRSAAAQAMRIRPQLQVISRFLAFTCNHGPCRRAAGLVCRRQIECCISLPNTLWLLNASMTDRWCTTAC